MKNVFLAPRSNETSFKNFESTIVGGRPYSFLEPFLTPDEKSVLSKYKNISIWGNKESLRSRWEKMQSGDFVLFYAKGSFNYSGQIALTKHSPELGAALWPVDEDGEPWTCLFFVDNLKEVAIPIQVLQELAGYAPTWDRVQGFMRLNDAGVQAIADKFGDIETFLHQKPEVYAAIDKVIEDLREESLEVEKDELYQIEDMSKVFNDASKFRYERDSHKIDTAPRKIRIENQTQKRRIAKLEGYACQVCDWKLEWRNSRGKAAYRIDVDHIIDKADGGSEEMNNLWVLCPNCHTKKTLGVITIDVSQKEVKEDGKKITLHHDRHLGFDTADA